MKRFFLPIMAILGLAATAKYFMRTDETTKHPIKITGPTPDLTVTDPAEVFKKAFWKRPLPADRILHAERREWIDEDAVSRWEWYIEVEPSPEIVRYLRDENAFRLKKADSIEIPPDAPAWFNREIEGGQILTSNSKSMQLIFTPGKLIAFGSGGGFHPGAGESNASEVAVIPSETGRLSSNPPPSSE